MDFAGMERTLDQLTADQIGAVLRMIAALERRGLPLGDADDWRLRLLARRRFLDLDGTATVDTRSWTSPMLAVEPTGNGTGTPLCRG